MADSTPIVSPGSSTTEFKLSVIVAALLSVAGLYKTIDPQLAAQLIAGLSGVYAAGRSIVKVFAKPTA